MGQRAGFHDLPAVIEACGYFFLLQAVFCLPGRTLVGRLVQRAVARRPGEADEVASAVWSERVVAAVARRLPWRSLCLQRSLVLVGLLARRGRGGNLRIGVRREGRDLVAHAWVEVAGQAINDSPEYTRTFAQLEPASSYPPDLLYEATLS